jgi:exopolysaccharide production protein ExoZ
MSDDHAVQSMNRDKLEWVQALRGIAALLVVVTHARRFFFDTPWQGFAQRYMLPAAQGVDLFFLVSGFIMVYTTMRSDGSVRYSAGFLLKRFARIWPVYAVMVAINAVLQGAWGDSVSSLHDVARSLAFLPVDTSHPPYMGLPLSIGWTLNFEFYFYLVFGLSLLAGRYRWIAFFGWMFATLIAVPLACTGSVSLLADHDYAIGIRSIDQVVNPIVWDFVAGTAVGLLYVSPARIRNRNLALALIVAAFALVCCWSLSGIVTFHGMARWGLPLAILFAVLALAAKSRELRFPRVLVWLGGVSYSLYLLHPFVFTTIDRLMDHLGLAEITHTPLFVLLVIPIPLLYAGISRRYLEDGLSVVVRKRLLGLIGRTHPVVVASDNATTTASAPLPAGD